MIELARTRDGREGCGSCICWYPEFQGARDQSTDSQMTGDSASSVAAWAREMSFSSGPSGGPSGLLLGPSGGPEEEEDEKEEEEEEEEGGWKGGGRMKDDGRQ